MFVYIISGISLIGGFLYFFKPSVFYKCIFNLSIIIIRNALWLKKVKQQIFNKKTDLIYKDKKIFEDLIIYEYELKSINNKSNYDKNYILKYIIENELIENENEETIKKEIKKKLLKLYNTELLHNELNKILHCSFYWEENPDTIIDLTQDLRHFILYFDCDKTTMCKFMKYTINNYKIKVDDDSKCGIYIIKNDDLFSEIKITIDNAKNITFHEMFKS